MTLAALERVAFLRGTREVLTDVSLRIERGERLALLGANGAGKTTLLRLLLGLVAPSSGSVTPCTVGVGYVPQTYAESLFPWFSVLRNVAMPRLIGARSDAEDVAARLCRTLLPAIDSARRAGDLSGGEKQITAIARALAAPGDLLVADEPFSALSSAAHPRARRVLAEELGERALVLVTHDTEDVADLCGRVLRLDQGRLVDVSGAGTER